jgi:hypothetical protein
MPDLQDIQRGIERMPIPEIMPIVQSAVNDETASVEPGWNAETISAISEGNGTLGFIRVHGSAVSTGSTVNWKSVVKVIDLSADGHWEDAVGTFEFPGNEVGMYRSGFFDQVEGRFKAAPCHGVIDIGGTALLWLADLSESFTHPWSREQFIMASHALGYFNGSWPEDLAPAGDWLERQFVTNRPRFARDAVWFNRFDLEEDAGLLANFESKAGIDGITTMKSEYNEIAVAASRVPRVVSHNDPHSRNAFIVNEGDVSTIYGIDWATVGLGPVGYDGGTLAGGGLIWKRDEARLIRDIEGIMFDEYMSGLGDAGFAFDREQVRLGFLSNFVIYPMAYLLAVVGMPDGQFAKNFSERFELTGDEFVDELAVRSGWFKPLFDEAVALARQLG